ncbi:MAG: MFS transporter [Melioribacter sp.]|uniref:MFS transporter n=1 Tax=Rosettibacter primus TaxID=3111523 RepID=UPI00247B79CE|nr:MFS transporter [Melioribacter sp.]
MKNKASLSVIFFTIFIDLMGFGILIPILPTFASKELGVQDYGIGIIVAIFSLMQFLFNPLLGKLSDVIGRKPIIAATLLLTSISYVIFSFANSFVILFLSRALAGLGGSNIAVAQAYIADITPPEERLKGMGIIGVAFGLGFVFGPLIGAFIAKFGYAVAGLSSAVFSFTAFLFALLILPESKQLKSERMNLHFKLFDVKYIQDVLRKPVVGLLIFIFFIIIFSIANLYGTFALLGYKFYHFTDQQNGILFGIMGVIGAIVQGVLIKFTNKISERVLLILGLILMMIGLAGIPYGGNFFGVIVVITILSIGTGILQPLILSMISKFSKQEEQGSILGLNQSFSAFARVLGPLWGGFSYDYLGYKAPFITGAIFTFFILIIVINFWKNII